MPDAGQTPELALRYLAELSTDVRAAVILDAGGAVAACSDEDRERGRRLGELVARLLTEADAAGEVAQVEVATAGGAVFAAREGGWTIAAVTERLALPSLMFYDLRRILADLGAKAA